MAGMFTNYGRKKLEEAFTITLASEWEPVRTVDGRIRVWVPSETLVRHYQDEGVTPPWERK